MAKEQLNYEQAMHKFMAAKARKRKALEHIEAEMKESYEKRTGRSADYFFAM